MSRRVLVPRTLPPLSALAAGPDGRVHRLSGATMGTRWAVSFAGPARLDPTRVRREVEVILDGVIAEMSQWVDHSVLSIFNRAPAGTWLALPEGFFTVLRQALRLAQETGGAYDPAIGPLVDLWGFGPNGAPAEPPDEALAAWREGAGGWRRLALDEVGRRAFQPGGLRLDLSSVAKGFAVDLLSERLAASGLPGHLVEIGGELKGQGCKPDGRPWWVALEEPGAPADRQEAGDTIVALHGLAVATSGDYRRFLRKGGDRLSHTLDPRTGRPVDHGLASVCVLHECCMLADALATALTVMGLEEGYAWAAERGLAARFIRRMPRGFAETMTPAFAALLD